MNEEPGMKGRPKLSLTIGKSTAPGDRPLPTLTGVKAMAISGIHISFCSRDENVTYLLNAVSLRHVYTKITTVSQEGKRS